MAVSLEEVGSKKLSATLSHENEEKTNHSSPVLSTVALLYGLMLISIGIVIPLAYVLSLWKYEVLQTMALLYYYYLHLVSIFGIIIIFVLIRKYKNIEIDEDDISIDVKPNLGDANTETSALSFSYPMKEIYIYKKIDFDNLYLKSGMIVFALASLALFLLMGFGTPMNPECYPVLFSIYSFIYGVFLIAEVSLFIIHKQIAIGIHSGYIKLILIHLMITNLCDWILAIILESTQSYSHVVLHSNTVHNISEMTHISNVTNHHTKEELPPNNYSPLYCLSKDSMINKASVYLFPFEIEFNLIAFSYLHLIQKNLFNGPHQGDVIQNDKRLKKCSIDIGDKLGIVLMICMIAPSLTFMSFKEGHVELFHNVQNEMLMYNIITFLSHLVTLIITIIASIRLKELNCTKSGKINLDKILLYGSFVCFNVIYIFALIANIPATNLELNESKGFILFNVILTLGQSLYQLYVIEYLSNCISMNINKDKDRYYLKLMSFKLLAFCNGGLWFIYSFMLKHITGSPILRNFYGDVAWVILSNIFLPITIFYRFHSGVILSEHTEVLYALIENDL